MDQHSNGNGGINHHHILLQIIPDGTMIASLLSICGGGSGKISTGTGYVFLFLLAGSCQFVIEGETTTLDEGDAISFDVAADNLISSDVTTSVLQLTFANSK